LFPQDKIYFPTCFYNKWADELGRYIVLKDVYGNRFIGFVSHNDKGAYFSFNQKKLRFMYQLTRFGLMKLLYDGNAKFEIKLLGHYLGRIDTNDPAKYNGHWGYDPMWSVEISESMARDLQPLVINWFCNTLHILSNNFQKTNITNLNFMFHDLI
jgi:hypothetical protein